MSVTHTPGPWHAISDSVYASNRAKSVANCDVGSAPVAEREYNAALISAAPDLLALVIQYRDDLRYPPTPDSQERRLQAITVAIRKATVAL
jgi:hypothetical protein